MEFVQQLVNGLTLGSVYALIAIGYTLIFGVLRLVYFAQGDLSMVAAFAMFLAMNALTGLGAPAELSVPFGLFSAVAAAALVAVASERLALRPLRRAARTKQLISTLGVMLVLQNAVYFFVTSENVRFPVQIGDAGLDLRGLVVTRVNVLIVAVTIVVMAATHFVLAHSRMGLKLRAVADNPVAAARLGINCSRVVQTTFALSGVLAAVAGVMISLYDGVVRFDMGFMPGIKGFTAAVLGGLGSIPGAVLGGALIGLVEALGAGYVSSEYRHVFVYLVLILALVFRNQGLLRHARLRSES